MAPSMVSWFRRGDLPEPPPPELAKLGLAPGYSVKYFKDPAELDRYAKQWGVAANDQWNARTIASAVIPALKVVCRLDPSGNLEDKELRQTRDAHEFAHTWDWRHDEKGGGWIAPKGWSMEAAQARLAEANKPKAPPTPAPAPADAAVQLAKSMAAPKPVEQPLAQTATTLPRTP
jgi:hypothetical protein